MIMKFTKVMDEIKEALYEFCTDQEAGGGYVCKEEIDGLLESSMVVLYRSCPSGGLPVMPIYRYQFFSDSKYSKEIFPESIKENGVVCDNGIMLGSFICNGYSDSDDSRKSLMTSYDVVYDMDDEEIKLIYKVSLNDENMLTIYRVDTYLFEEFDFYDFIFDLTMQISCRLKQSLSEGGKFTC